MFCKRFIPLVLSVVYLCSNRGYSLDQSCPENTTCDHESLSSNKCTANTNCGKVEGLWSENEKGCSFRGIPYASPPIGTLRWRPPVGTNMENNNCWSGTLSATDFGSPCVQRDFSNHSNVIGNEDCLYLNVMTPTVKSDAQLPVLFWIHGGYLTFGSGNAYEIGYAPTLALAKKLNVVFVSMNYRLNAFGFMALDWLRAGSPTNTSGNYGFMDIIEALRWVQANIKNFGGDPTHVTIFGHSAGATAEIALLASPLSVGLFHKAWVTGAASILNKTATDVFKDNEIFVTNTGCSNVTCLYELTQQEVIFNIPWDVYPYWNKDDFFALPEKGRLSGALAIIDGYVLKDAPFEVWANGNGIDVPVMIGTTAQETDLSPLPSAVVNWTWETSDYRDHVTSVLAPFSDFIATTALNLYPENVSTPEFQLTSMSSDLRANCGNAYSALILSSGIKSPVYHYVATYYSKDKLAIPFGFPSPARYAYHGIEILGFFGTMDKALTSPGPDDLIWEKRMQAEIMTFVKTGKPKTVKWKPYPESTAELDKTTQVSTGYHSAQCDFWLKNGFFSHSWMN